MIHLDLCCGLGGWSQPFDAQLKWKQQRKQPSDRRGELAAQIPQHIAYALKRSVEAYGGTLP